MHFLDVTLFPSLLMFLFISFCIIAQNLFIAQMLFLFCTVNVRMRESLFLPTQYVFQQIAVFSLRSLHASKVLRLWGILHFSQITTFV